MSFRKVGGVQYSATQNVVKSRYNTSDNLYVSQYVGEPNTFINFLSDISGNQIYGDLDVSGNLHVSGDIDCSGNLYTDKDAYINGVRVGRGGGDVNTNTVVGFEALKSNEALGTDNTATGYQSLFKNTEGNENVAIGVGALFSNTTGKENIAVGWAALGSNTIGSENVAVGHSALVNNKDNGGSLYGQQNVAIGNSSLFNNTIGTNNVALGYQAGLDLSGNSNTNTFLGSNANVSSSGIYSNATAIGYDAKVDSSNKIRLGNISVTVIEGQVAYSYTSDARDKKDIELLDAGLNFINVLKPVRFIWNARNDGIKDIQEVGFIAQDLLQAQKDTGITIPRLVHDEDPEHLSITSSSIIPILVKSVQELSAKVNTLEAELNQIKSKSTLSTF
jgi:hypothetical protein